MKATDIRLHVLVKVDRNRTPQQVFNATGYAQYVNRKMQCTIPRAEGEEVEVHFFTIDRPLDASELEREYELRGLRPDPYALAAVNEAEPDFLDKYPNCCQWDVDGRTSTALMFYNCNGRWVGMHGSSNTWGPGWWFGGVRK